MTIDISRRKFIVLSLTGVSILIFDVSCAWRKTTGQGKEPDLPEEVNVHLEVFQALFSPEFVTATIIRDTLRCDNDLLHRLGLDHQKIHALGDDANLISKSTFGVPFTSLDWEEKESIIDKLMEHPERLNTYRALRNLLFADPKYAVDPMGTIWKKLEYQSFDYTANDAWQGG